MFGVQWKLDIFRVEERFGVHELTGIGIMTEHESFIFGHVHISHDIYCEQIIITYTGAINIKLCGGHNLKWD